ncbi:MAG: hypothetical protein AAF609_27010 [Cyanobacteria bacterium P01_C01_bin.120]
MPRSYLIVQGVLKALPIWLSKTRIQEAEQLLKRTQGAIAWEQPTPGAESPPVAQNFLSLAEDWCTQTGRG